VLITSSTPKRSLSITGTTIQAAPAAKAAPAIMGRASQPGHVAACTPIQVAAIAPA
jgi:hypothetical protein